MGNIFRSYRTQNGRLAVEPLFMGWISKASCLKLPWQFFALSLSHSLSLTLSLSLSLSLTLSQPLTTARDVRGVESEAAPMRDELAEEREIVGERGQSRLAQTGPLRQHAIFSYHPLHPERDRRTDDEERGRGRRADRRTDRRTQRRRTRLRLTISWMAHIRQTDRRRAHL